MARKARELSIINSYAICFNAKDGVVFSNQDKLNFLHYINEIKKDSFELLAYNLKDKAFYLVAFDIKMNIDILLRKICVKFAKKYNLAYRRTGKVFGDRASTTPAQNYDEVFSLVLRVHELNNLQPTKYCSFKKYFEDEFIDKDFILERFGSSEEFYKFSKDKNNMSTESLQKKLTDNELEQYIQDTYKLDGKEVKDLSKNKLNKLISNIVAITKASARQISRVTTIPLRYLWELGKKDNKKESKKDAEEKTNC